MRSESKKFRPKEKIYQGKKFPCKHEERFAIYFNSLGVPWAYESHTFALSQTTYKPDFLLRDLMTFVEVKPADLLEETWKIHELSLQQPNYSFLVASMSPTFDLKLHKFGRLIDGQMRWFEDYEISWVFCRLCCHPYVSVDNPDWPLLNCPRCGFDVGENSFTDAQAAKILPVDVAKRWWNGHRNDSNFPQRLINREYRQAIAGLEGKVNSFDCENENYIECPF